MHHHSPPIGTPTVRVPAARVPAANALAAEVPAARVPAARVPAAKVPAAEVPAARVPAARVPAAKIPTAKGPAAKVPAAKISEANVPAAEVPAAEVPAAKIPAAKIPAAKVPAAKVPAAEVPAAEVPAAKIPAANVPAAEVPAARVPAARVPAANVPAANVPAANIPAGRSSSSHDDQRESWDKPARRHLDRQKSRPRTRTNRDEWESEPVRPRWWGTKTDKTHSGGARRTESWAKKLTRSPRTSAKTPRMYLGSAPPVERERTSGRPALRSSAHAEYRFLGLDAGDREASRMNMDAARSMKKIPRMYLGSVPPVERERISGRPAPRSGVHMEHRPPGLDTGDRDVSRLDMDTESCSELPRLYMGPEAEDVAPRMHLGEARRDEYESRRALRVNMIRARGEEVEVSEEEPRFGGSRAAPLQGADCGRPSRSANEGGANDENDESETEGRPRTCRRRRRLPEVPYTTASSDERYHGTDGGSRSRAKTTEPNSQTNKKTSTLVPEEVGYRKTSTMVPRVGLENPKTSTLVPEVGFGLKSGYEFGYETSWTRASSSVDTTDEHCLELENDGTWRETDPADQDPWNKAMYGVLEQPEQRRGAESERTDREVSYQRYQDILDEGFLFNRPAERQRGDAPPVRAAQEAGGRPSPKAESRGDQRRASERPRHSVGNDEQTRGQPSRACSSLIQESLLEEVAGRGWIEDRRRPKATYNEGTDWRFQGVVGQASRLPRAGT